MSLSDNMKQQYQDDLAIEIEAFFDMLVDKHKIVSYKDIDYILNGAIELVKWELKK